MTLSLVGGPQEGLKFDNEGYVGQMGDVSARVLIADDDVVVRDVVRRYLERDGMTVSVAGDGHEALRMLGTERIDVAVLDVMMPGPNGLALCRSLRQTSDFTVPVILLTALGEESDRIAGLEAGADDYLTKPFSPRELALRVRSVLRRAPAPVGRLPLDITVGDLTVSTAARTAHTGGRPVGLDQPGVRPAVVLHDPPRHRVHPRRTVAAGVALGFRRFVHGDRARQTAPLQTR